MKLWQKKYATITDAVHALASRRNALPEDAIKHGLITAVWQGKFEGAMVLHHPSIGQEPISRDELRDAARAFAGLWKGDTLPEVAASEAAMTLGAWLQGRYPEAGRKTIDRMVNGYPAPKAETDAMSIASAEPKRHIFLNGLTTTLDAILSEGDCVCVPAVPPFVANLSFDALARLDLPAYDGPFKKTYLDCLMIKTAAIERWLASPRKRTMAPDEKAELIRRYKEVVDNANNRWPDLHHRPKYFVDMADQLILKGKACGFKKQVLSRILAATYGPMIRHGLPGIDGPR